MHRKGAIAKHIGASDDRTKKDLNLSRLKARGVQSRVGILLDNFVSISF